MDLYSSKGGSPLFDRWKSMTQARLRCDGSSRRSIAEIVRSVHLSPSALTGGDPDSSPISIAGAGIRPRRHDDMVATMARFHQVALAPFWSRIQALLVADRDARGRSALSSGLTGLLATLHPQVRWQLPVLQIITADSRYEEIKLGGRGLAILPSVFRQEPAVYEPADGEDGAPVLVYPVPLDELAIDSLWSVTGSADRALAALLGRTRSGILRTLTDTCNTSELGRKLGVSTAAASQHTSVLREAGLITTRRNLNMVLHTLTPLGVAVIQGRFPDIQELPSRAQAYDAAS
ncbi:winged helix-turn-helix domain-containing protein [Micromonospora sp. NPDC051296]|uniref:ArsR/SmtB family transcription factor n=1 Tax=Micromonospora sp. NPDC051296 TaxID=3155046 RepID=UPI00341D5839